MSLFQNCNNAEPGRNDIMAADTGYSAVVREWSKRIAKYPKNTEYKHSRALDLMGDGQYNDALLDMDEALELEKSVDFYLTKAAILMELNRPVDAENAMKSAMEFDPTNDEAHFTLGKFYFVVLKYKESKLHLEEAINLNSSNIDAYFTLGMVHKEDGDTSLAIKYFNRVVEIDLLNSEALHQIANLLSEQEDPEGLEYFDRLLSSNDLDFMAYYGRGLLYQRLNHFDKAMVDYQKTIDLRPEFYLAYYGAGYILTAQKKYERAIEHFRLAVKFAPELAKGYYMIGICQEGLNNKEQALKFYTMTLQVKPDYEKAKQRISELTSN
jgi:tetratricopeptide (TPR) repeat protein